MEKILQKYKENLTPDSATKSKIWDKIEKNLPTTNKKYYLGLGLNWKGLFVVFILLFGSLSFVTLSYLSNTTLKNQTESSVVKNVDKSQDSPTAEGNYDSSDPLNSSQLIVSPDVKYYDHIDSGEQLTVPITITYSGPDQSAAIDMTIVDFDIDRDNCENTIPTLNRQTANSALSWAQGLNSLIIQNAEKKTTEIMINIPFDVEPGTYWVAVKATVKTTGQSGASLLFITVGDTRSINCFSTKDIHYKI
jgi:hypothetical protein